MNTHFLAGMTFVDVMREFHVRLTADELSRGANFWRAQKARARAIFVRTVGDDKLQRVADYMHKCDEAARRAVTYHPCSRTIYLPAA